MIQHRERLSEALGALQTAAENELRDNPYYMVSHKIGELQDVSGLHLLKQSRYGSPPPSFLSALEHVRRSADEALSDNRFYAFAHRLDALSFIAGSFANGAAPHSIPKGDRQTHSLNSADNSPSKNRALQPEATHQTQQSLARSFDDLAVASIARLRTTTTALNGNTSEQPLRIRRPSAEGMAACLHDQTHMEQTPRTGTVWYRWRPPALLPKAIKVPNAGKPPQRSDSRTLRPLLAKGPIAPSALRRRPKVHPRFRVPRQKMIPRPLQPAKRSDTQMLGMDLRNQPATES